MTSVTRTSLTGTGEGWGYSRQVAPLDYVKPPPVSARGVGADFRCVPHA